MNDLTQIELPELYDLLAHQTSRYMKMLSQGAPKQEFDQSKEAMIAIQVEIRSRHNQKSVNKASPADNLNLSVNSNGAGA